MDAIFHQPHLAAVGDDVLLDDGKPDAGAAHCVVRLADATVKRFEHAVTVCLGHTGALVRNVHAHAARMARERQPHRSPFGRKTNGVGQQVADCRGDFVGVNGQRDGGSFHQHPQAPGLPLQPLGFHLGFQQREQIGVAPLQLACLEGCSIKAQQGFNLTLQNQCVVVKDLCNFALAGIEFTVNPRLVRGLDYYNKTVFEWVTTELGAQGTVCAGGRYDGLVEQRGGKATPAVGFALGLERLVLLLQTLELLPQLPAASDIYLMALGEQAELAALSVAERLRSDLPGTRVMVHCGGGNLKKQIKRADKSGATVGLILGEDELARGEVTVKWLREDKPQQTVLLSELAKTLAFAA